VQRSSVTGKFRSSDVLTLDETAEYLRIDPQQVLRYVTEGSIPASKLGNRWRFNKNRLDEWRRADTAQLRHEALEFQREKEGGVYTPQPGSSIGLHQERVDALISQVLDGFSYQVLEQLAANLGLSVPAVAEKLGMPARTLSRRKTDGRLTADESERALRLAMLYERAIGLFDGNIQAAQEWLKMPKKALNGESPISFASTELGARTVENLIGRIEHGVYS